MKFSGRHFPGEVAAAFKPESESDELREEALVQRYAELFGHTARGQVTPYETEYGKAALFLQPHELADLGGFLAAFGLDLDPSRHDRVDHVQVEFEFMPVLARKDAHALEVDDAEML